MRDQHTRTHENEAFWNRPCTPSRRAWLLLVLVACFVAQTMFVYADHGDTRPLTPEQTRGRQLWQAKNCQTCHQLYGYGGFLGPDLTNATARLDRHQLDSLLTVGLGQMPAFGLAQPQINDIWAFLQAMNQTGQGQARNPALFARAAIEQSAVAENTNPSNMHNPAQIAIEALLGQSDLPEAQAGYKLFETGTCTSCHSYFARSAVGAPDLSLSGMTLSDEALALVLSEGRSPRMPKPDLTAAEQRSMAAFIRFLATNRDELRQRTEAAPKPFWSTLPWWEYP